MQRQHLVLLLIAALIGAVWSGARWLGRTPAAPAVFGSTPVAAVGSRAAAAEVAPAEAAEAEADAPSEETARTPVPEVQTEPAAAEDGYVPTVTFIARDTEGDEVAGARITALGAGERTVLGETDANGELRTELPVGGRLRIFATSPAHAAAEIGAHWPYPARMGIVLEAKGTIRGVVRFADGEAAGPAIEVRAELRGRDGPVVEASALTDLDGAFELEGLTYRREYDVVAFAPGLLSRRDWRRVRPSVTPLFLVVGEVYGAHLRLVEPDGRPASVSTDRRSSGVAPRLRSTNRSTAVLARDAVLAGLPSSYLELPRSHRLKFFLADDTEEPELGPFMLQVDLPGYEPEVFEYYARPQRTGLAEYDVVLRPRAVGTIELEFLTAPGVGPRPGDDSLGWSSGVLRLWGADRRPVSYQLPPPFGTRRIESVPVGAYQALLELLPGRFRYPEDGSLAALEVSDRPARLTVDLRHLGAVRLTLEGIDRVSGSLRSTAGPLVARLNAIALVEGVPFVFLLAAGDYSFHKVRSIEGLEAIIAGDASALPFTVRPGSTTEVPVVIRTR